MKLVNVGLLKHPMNWVIVLLMLVLAGIGGHLILSLAGFEPKTSQAPSTGQTENAVEN